MNRTKKTLVAALAAVSMQAAAQTTRLVPMDYSVQIPQDWPKLEERLTIADKPTIARWCQMPPHIAARADSCAVLDFRYELCMIYATSEDPDVIKHEREHCAGYSHQGEGRRALDAWERWKQNRKQDAITHR